MLDNTIEVAAASNPIEPQMEAPEPIILDREAMLGELHVWAKAFITRSKAWRLASFEPSWLVWARNATSIYDPELSKKKEPWQSRAFWPVTASHRENAQSQLYKTEIGPKPPIEVKARPGLGGAEDQAQNIRDLILREREKARYDLHRNGVIDDKTTYGSGFAQVYFETKIEDRVLQEPIFEEINLSDLGSITRAMKGERQIVGYRPVVKPQVIYRGVRFRDLSIWDVFPDPQSLQIKGHPIGLRYKTTYGEIVEGAKPGADGRPGYVLPEAVEKLKEVASEEMTPPDKQELEADRGISEAQIVRTDYGRLLECYEIQARLPKKWVLINGEEIDDPEALMPAKVRFHELCVIGVEMNDSYDGEPNIYKDDYFPVKGQFYAMGIPEMLKDVQSVTNESINQRLDNAIVSLLNVYAVIEKAVVDPKDFTLGPGSVLRMKAQEGIADIEKLFKRVDMGTLDRAAFIEPQEWERAAQERTSVNRQTLGTSDQVKDSNQTLGGQQLLLQATGDKMAYLGMLSECGFQYDVTHAFYKLIYQNYNPEDVALALGPERAARFIPMSPEQVENSYQYMTMGIFQMENKAQRQARLAAIREQFVGAPWMNDIAFFDAELITADEDPIKFRIPEAEAVQIMAKAEQMAVGMVEQQNAAQAQPGKPAPKKPAGPPK